MIEGVNRPGDRGGIVGTLADNEDLVNFGELISNMVSVPLQVTKYKISWYFELQWS